MPTRRYRISLAALIVLASCRARHVSQLEPEYIVPAGDSRPRPLTERSLDLHDSIAAALGVPALRTALLPDSVSELRASTGHGMIAGAEYVTTLVIPTGQRAWMDAGDLLIEERRGSDYHAIAVNAPAMRSGEDAVRAVMIATLIDSLTRAPQD